METNKEFIPYEQALALKELGFDGDCFAIWSGFDEHNFSITDTIRLYSSGFRINGTQSATFYTNDFNSPRASAPTYSQAFRWFREKYGLCVHSKPENNEEGVIVWEYVILTISDSEVCFTVRKSGYALPEEAELECLKKLIELCKNYI